MITNTLTIRNWTEIDLDKVDNITVIYCRLSSEDIDESETNSISNQWFILAKVAEVEGFQNPITFIDYGFSESNFNRSAISKALEEEYKP